MESFQYQVEGDLPAHQSALMCPFLLLLLGMAQICRVGIYHFFIFALCETGPIGKPFAMTIVRWRVKCSHSKRLSNTEDVSSGSGFAASVGACHPDISWHYRDIYSAVLFPLPSKHGLIFLECTAGEFLLEISLLRVRQHKNPSPTSWPTKVDQRVLIKPVGLWAGLSASQPSAGLVFLAGGQVHHAVIHPEMGKIAVL